MTRNNSSSCGARLTLLLLVVAAPALGAAVFLDVPLDSGSGGDKRCSRDGAMRQAAAGGEDSSSSSGRARPPPPPPPLGQLSWTLRNGNGTIAVPATVPGHVHLDLLAAGVLNQGDPYFGTNELAYSWVALEDWTYVLTLPRECWGVDPPRDGGGGGGGGGCVDNGGDGGGSEDGDCGGRIRRASAHEGGEASAAAVGLLTFEGIDTFATIRVNGQEIGRWSNQFMPATFALSGGILSELLTKQVSTIEVTIRSALVEARERAAASRKPVPDSVFFGDWAEPAHRNFARKAGADFGWDWGPAFVPAGLPGSVSLTVTSTGRLLPDVAVAQDWGTPSTAHQDNTFGVVEITVTAFLDGFEEPGRRGVSPVGDKGGGGGGGGGGVFVDGEGIDDDVARPVPPSSAPSSDDLRRGVVFFSLSEPADKKEGSGGGSGGDGGRNTVVAEACVPLVLRADDDDAAAMAEAAAEPAPVQPGVADNNTSRAGSRYQNLRRTAGESVWPVRAKMTVTYPRLWWPRGMGRSRQQQQQQQPPLYTLRVDWYPGKDASCPLLGDAVPVSGSDAVAAAAATMAVDAETTAAAAVRKPGAGSASLGAAFAAAVGDGADGDADENAGDGVVKRSGTGINRGNSGAAEVAPQSSVRRSIGLRKVELVRVPIAAAAAAGAAAGNDRGGGVAQSAGVAAEAAAGAVGEGSGDGLGQGVMRSAEAAALGVVAENGPGGDVIRSAGTAAGTAAAAGATSEQQQQQQQRQRQQRQQQHGRRQEGEQTSPTKEKNERLGGGGETMYFRVNGVDVFARGSNFVPPDAWGQRVTEEKRRWLLESAAAANMNMIRVWGGGPPQPRSFYTACDELGLMVWQDLPYACALYPVDAPPPSATDFVGGGGGGGGRADGGDDASASLGTSVGRTSGSSSTSSGSSSGSSGSSTSSTSSSTSSSTRTSGTSTSSTSRRSSGSSRSAVSSAATRTTAVAPSSSSPTQGTRGASGGGGGEDNVPSLLLPGEPTARGEQDDPSSSRPLPKRARAGNMAEKEAKIGPAFSPVSEGPAAGEGGDVNPPTDLLEEAVAKASNGANSSSVSEGPPGGGDDRKLSPLLLEEGAVEAKRIGAVPSPVSEGPAAAGGEDGYLSPALLEEAAKEARGFVRRLSAHPSVVCWGGNNEVEQALGWFNESSSEPGRQAYERDYVALFVDTIGNAVRSVDPFTPWVDSSPSNGVIGGFDRFGTAVPTARPATAVIAAAAAAATAAPTSAARTATRRRIATTVATTTTLTSRPSTTAAATETQTSTAAAAGDGGATGPGGKRWGDPNNPKYGDIHFYDYGMDCEDSDRYPDAKFVSEHGVQSFPSMASYKQVVNPRDMWLGSPALAFRQRHEGGDEQISRQMRRHFDFRLSPEEERLLGKEGGAAGEEALRAYLLLSQIQQGRCLETAIRKWRGAGIEGEGAWGTNRVWDGYSNSDRSSETDGLNNSNDDGGVVDRDNNSNDDGGVVDRDDNSNDDGVVVDRDNNSNDDGGVVDRDNNSNSNNNNNNVNNKNERDEMSKRATTSKAAAAEAQSKQRTTATSGFQEEDASSGMRDGAGHNVHHRMVQGEGALSDADRARFGDMPPDKATAVRGAYPSPSPAAATAVARTRGSTRGTMGVLYWQLSDTWQGPSWSTIEYDGAWKVSHHMVRRAFSLVSIAGTVVKRPRTAEESGDGVGDDVETSWFVCHVTPDLEGVVAGSYTVSVYLWDDNCDPVASWRGTVGPMSPGSTTKVFQATTDDLRRVAGADKMIVHMVFEETVEAGTSNDAAPTAVERVESVYYLSSANAAESVTVDDLPETRLSWEVLPAPGAAVAEFHEGERTVRVRARAHAAHVTLRLDQPQPKPQQHEQQREHAASAATATGMEQPPRPQPPQRGPPWQQEAPPLSSPRQLPRFHANDGGFHVFPCRAHDLQVRYRGNSQDLEDGSSGIKAESLRELLAAIEAGKRD